MEINGLEQPIIIAIIYIIFFIISAIIAFTLFKYLPGSTAATEGSIRGIAFKAGGAFAGFLISFIVLHLAYTSIILPIRLNITGNVFDEDKNPIPNAEVSVDGVDRYKYTDKNGWFTIEVNRQREWTVRAREPKLFQPSFITTNPSKIDKPIVITLKKKISVETNQPNAANEEEKWPTILPYQIPKVEVVCTKAKQFSEAPLCGDWKLENQEEIFEEEINALSFREPSKRFDLTSFKVIDQTFVNLDSCFFLIDAKTSRGAVIPGTISLYKNHYLGESDKKFISFSIHFPPMLVPTPPPIDPSDHRVMYAGYFDKNDTSFHIEQRVILDYKGQRVGNIRPAPKFIQISPSYR